MSSRFSAILASQRISMLASPSPVPHITTSSSPEAPDLPDSHSHRPISSSSYPHSAAAESEVGRGATVDLVQSTVRAAAENYAPSYEPCSTRTPVYGGPDVVGAGDRGYRWMATPGVKVEEQADLSRAWPHASWTGQRYLHQPVPYAPRYDGGVDLDPEHGDEPDVGGEYAFTFDSPVLVPTHTAGDADIELASPESIALHSPIDHAQVSPISPVSPASGTAYRQVGGGRALSYGHHTAYPSQHYQVGAPQPLTYGSGSISAAPTYSQYEPIATASSHYPTSLSAPTHAHETYYSGPASYPPTYPSPVSMTAYQSFAYAHSQSYDYPSLTEHDPSAIEYASFPPPSSVPPAHRRISTGGIFPSTHAYPRAPSPPRSSASLLAANFAYAEQQFTPLVKLEPDSPDLPPAMSQSPVDQLFGSPMSASSFGGGGPAILLGSNAGDGFSPAPVTPAKKYASPASPAKRPQHKRRSSAAADLDYDPSPSSSTSGAPANSKMHLPISPITGKPVKVISKRGWPPKDAHKRVYECQFDGCSKTFGRPSARDTHMRSHTGDKPFTCPIPSCARGFGVFSNLKRHMIVHPTVDFRHVSVHDLPQMHFVPDAEGAAPTPEGGKLEWLDVEEGVDGDGDGEGEVKGEGEERA